MQQKVWEKAESSVEFPGTGAGAVSVRHSHRFIWRNLPNAISVARLLAAPVLLGLASAHREGPFQWLFLACLLSDLLDGPIARRFHLQSSLGALLDSTADIAVSAAGAAGVFIFRPDFIHEHYSPICLIISLYIIEVGASLVRYRRISSFHTLLARAAACAQGVFVMSLFLWDYRAWLFWPMVGLSAVAYLEELILLAIFPIWKTNVGGLCQVLSERRRARHR